jgi:hypothetical protein
MDNVWFRTTFPKEPGMLPLAIVLWEKHDGTWVVHNEHTHEDGRQARSIGDYCDNFDKALKIYQARVANRLKKFKDKVFRERCVDGLSG